MTDFVHPALIFILFALPIPFFTDRCVKPISC